MANKQEPQKLYIQQFSTLAVHNNHHASSKTSVFPGVNLDKVYKLTVILILSYCIKITDVDDPECLPPHSLF